ncbi:oligosaccharide flippase family protein [Nocardioides sp. SYSU DS0651]|uniref:oligosaccharide flippase family protein n=1 Tax=Nocardioides sp. SYSU DS0651 TaxID=3415955 RepID=UPI003F4BF414
MTEAVGRHDALRRTGATVLALGVSELLGKVATFLMFLLMARLLGVAEFGLLSFGLSLGLLLAVVSSLDLDSRVVQLGSARPDLLDRCFGALVAIRAVLSAAVLGVATPVLFATMGADAATTVVVLVASCLVDTFTDASRAACGALQRQQLSAVVLVVQRFSALLLTAAALLRTGEPLAGALGYLLGTTVGAVGMYVAARRAGARLRVRGSGREARLVLAAAPVMGLGAVASMGIFRLDAALIGLLLGTTAVGVYGAGYRVFESVLFVSWTLSRAYMPVVASRPDDADHVRTWARRAFVVVCAAYLPFGAVLAVRGDDLVGLLFGAAYAHTGVVLGLAAAPVLFGIAHLGASVLLALRPDPVVLLAGVVALATNVALNLWLIPVWGITAAAVTTCLAFLVQSVILVTALSRVAGSVVPGRALLPVVAATAGAAAAAGLVDRTVPAVCASMVVFLLAWPAASRVLDPAGFALARSAARATLRRRPAEDLLSRAAA